MKKVILIFICLIFLSGCEVTYELTLNDNNITEKLTLIETNSSLFDVQNDLGWTLRETFDSLLTSDEFSDDIYSVKSLNSEGQLGVEYYSSELDDIINSSAINQCYINPQMIEDENIITINTGNNFKCYEYYENLETIKVVFKTNHKVISSNADIVEDNKYIWNITKEGNKQIEISYDKTDVSTNYWPIIIICMVVILLIGIVAYYIYNKQNNENKI